MKHYPAKCRTKRCSGLVTSAGHSPYCPSCRRERFKEAHPLSYAWGNLKRRARQRGIAFSLTLEEYEAFALRTNYAELHGKTSLSLSIDRIENGLGYHAWNIQAMTIRENSRKQFVPYYNQGVPPDVLSEYHAEEIARRSELEAIAAEIIRHGFRPGSKVFWHKFNERKAALIPI